MHNCNNRETVIIPQTIIVPTNSIIVASLFTHGSNKLGNDVCRLYDDDILNRPLRRYRRIKLHQHVLVVKKRA